MWERKLPERSWVPEEDSASWRMVVVVPDGWRAWITVSWLRRILWWWWEKDAVGEESAAKEKGVKPGRNSEISYWKVGDGKHYKLRCKTQVYLQICSRNESRRGFRAKCGWKRLGKRCKKDKNLRWKEPSSLVQGPSKFTRKSDRLSGDEIVGRLRVQWLTLTKGQVNRFRVILSLVSWHLSQEARHQPSVE